MVGEDNGRKAFSKDFHSRYRLGRGNEREIGSEAEI
jgi:hypothetical protein